MAGRSQSFGHVGRKSVVVPQVLGLNHAQNVVIATPGRLIFVAGQVPAGPDMVVPAHAVGDLHEQTLIAFRNVEHCLIAAGATKADLVKVTSFVVGYGPHAGRVVRDARAEFFDDVDPPTSAVYGVTALFDPLHLIEIEAIAITP